MALPVGDLNATINGTLHDAKDPGTSGGVGQTSVKVSTEGTWAIVNMFYRVHFTVDFSLSFIDGVQVEFLQNLQKKNTLAVIFILNLFTG